MVKNQPRRPPKRPPEAPDELIFAHSGCIFLRIFSKIMIKSVLDVHYNYTHILYDLRDGPAGRLVDSRVWPSPAGLIVLSFIIKTAKNTEK